MSKNIDEIFKEVRKVANTIALTKAGCVDCRFNNNDLCDDCAKEAFKALTEKKLIRPMSKKEIGYVLLAYLGDFNFVDRLAESLYEAQFKGDE